MATRRLTGGRTLAIADVLYLVHRLSVELCREDADGQKEFDRYMGTDHIGSDYMEADLRGM